jgi:hypothetical protein
LGKTKDERKGLEKIGEKGMKKRKAAFTLYSVKAVYQTR